MMNNLYLGKQLVRDVLVFICLITAVLIVLDFILFHLLFYSKEVTIALITFSIIFVTYFLSLNFDFMVMKYGFNNDMNILFTTSGLYDRIVSMITEGCSIFGYVITPVWHAIIMGLFMINEFKYAITFYQLKRLLYLFVFIQTMLRIRFYNIKTTIKLWIQFEFVLYRWRKLAIKQKIDEREKNSFIYHQIIKCIDYARLIIQVLLNKCFLKYKGIYGGCLA